MATSILTLLGIKPKGKPEPPKPESPPEPEPKPPPTVLRPPSYFDCGHMNWGTDEAQAAAREEGFCCAGGQKKRPTNHQVTKGTYRKPVPKKQRKSIATISSGGFPGLCCDAEGFYIGGISNDCRRMGALCTYHQQLLTEETKRQAKRSSKEGC